MRSYIASPAPTDPRQQHQRTTSRHFVLPSFERATFQSFVRHRRWGGGERRNASVNDVAAASPRRPTSMFIASNERRWTGEGILTTSSGAQPRSRLTSTGSAATIRFADLEQEAKQQVGTPVDGTQQDVPFEELLKDSSPAPQISSTSSSSSQHSRLWLSNPVEKAQQCPAPSPQAATTATSNANYADELRLWQANREHRRTRSEAASISPLPPSDVGHASGVLVASGGKPQHKGREELHSDSQSSPISPSVLPPRPSHPSPPPFPRRMVSVTSTNEASDRTVRPEFSQQGLHPQLREMQGGQHHRQASDEDDVAMGRSNSSLEEVISARAIDSLGQRERNVSLTSTNGDLSAAQGSSVLISSIYNDAQPPRVQARQSLPADGLPRGRAGSVYSVAHSLDIVGARDSFHSATTTPTADRWARAASSVPSPPPLPPRRVSSHTPSSSTDHSRSAKVRASKDLSSAQARRSLSLRQDAHDVQSGEGHGRPLSGTATSLAFQTATEHNGAGQSGGDYTNKTNSQDCTHLLPGSFEAVLREKQTRSVHKTQPQPMLPQPAAPSAVPAPIRGPRKQPPPPPSPAPQRIELPPVHSSARPSPVREASAPTGSASETSSFASIKYWRQVVAVEAFLGSTERVSKTQASSSRIESSRAPQQQPQRSRQVSGATTGGSSPTTTAGTVSSRRRLSDREAAKLFGRLAPCNNADEQRAVGRAPSTQQEAPLVVGGMVAAAGGIARPSEDKRASMPSTTDTFGVAAAAARSGSLHNRITEVIEEGQAFSREGGGHEWQQDALPSLLRRSASSPDMALLCSDFTPLEERGARGSLDRYAPIPSNSSHVATTSAVTATATAEDDDDDDGALLVISLIAQRVGLAGQALLSLGHDLAEYQRQATATTTPTAGGGTSTSTRGARRRRDGGPAV